MESDNNITVLSDDTIADQQSSDESLFGENNTNISQQDLCGSVCVEKLFERFQVHYIIELLTFLDTRIITIIINNYGILT